MKKKLLSIFLLTASSMVRATDSGVSSVPNYEGEDRYKHKSPAVIGKGCDGAPPSDTVSIGNATSSIVYYDARVGGSNKLFDSDRGLAPQKGYRYCKQGGGTYLIEFDADLRQPGIQLRTIEVTTGSRYKFVENNGILGIARR